MQQRLAHLRVSLVGKRLIALALEMGRIANESRHPFLQMRPWARD
jgi:hypothetical protein